MMKQRAAGAREVAHNSRRSPSIAETRGKRSVSAAFDLVPAERFVELVPIERAALVVVGVEPASITAERQTTGPPRS